MEQCNLTIDKELRTIMEFINEYETNTNTTDVSFLITKNGAFFFNKNGDIILNTKFDKEY